MALYSAPGVWDGPRVGLGWLGLVVIEEIQRKSRVRKWTPQNAPRIRAGVEKKDQTAELKKNQTRRCYAEKKPRFLFQTTGRHPPGARRETTEVKTRKC